MENQNSQAHMELRLAKDISASLQKLLGFHRQLWDQVRAERDALVNADRNLIQEVALAKQALVESIRVVESARLKVVAQLEKIWGQRGTPLSLSELIVRVQGADQALASQLRTQQNALRHLAERIQLTNESNRQLVESSMKHVDRMKKNLMGEVDPKSALYTPQGNKGASGPQGSQARFLSREA